MNWTNIAINLGILLYILTILAIIYTIILENRNPVRTLAWMLVLILVPGIGLFFYIYFGMNYRKIKMFSMKGLGDFKWLQYMSEDQKQRIKKTELLKKEDMEAVKPLMTLLLNNSKALLSRNNTVEILNNGEATFSSIFKAIAKAKKYIHLEYYIIDKGELGEQLKELLIEKAKEGVEVRVIYDDVGSWKLPKRYIKEMQAAGIQIYPFLPVRFPLFTNKVNYRNHRKIVVIDGKVGFMGGMNIADRYTKGTSWGTWRDTHFKIIGKGVHGLQAAFLIDWYVVSKKLLNEKIYYPPLPVYSDDNIMQICTSGPVGQWRTLLQAAIFTVANAKKYVFIQTPYFLPTEGLNQALQIAALGGVDVRLMLPKRSDTRTANMATHSFIDEMVKAGVKVYFYKPGFLHSKLMVADDELTCIGSANMDFRSFEHNFEINAFVYQPSFAQQMRKVFLHDMHSCERLVPSRWLKRPLKQRIAESFMRLFSPLL